MINLEKALSIANDCVSIARSIDAKPIAVVVLDKHGNTVVSLKEDNARTRFLTDIERKRLFEAAKKSKWERLYHLVLQVCLVQS